MHHDNIASQGTRTPSDWGAVTPLQRATAVIAIAAASAFAAGFARDALILYRWLFRERILFLSRDILWMAPLGNALLFAFAAVPVALLAWWAPRFATLRSALVVFGFLGAVSTFLLFGGIHPYASLVLSLGVAWRLAEAGTRDAERTARRARRAALAQAALVAVVGVGLRAGFAFREARALAQLPRAAAGAPNILLIILDTVGAANLSLYGYARPTTPGLERWAREGVVFDWAIAPSSWTLPSHGTFFTGQWPGALSGSWKHRIDDTYPTLAEALRTKGYYTAGFGGNPYYTNRESGLSRGFVHYEEWPITGMQLLKGATLMQSWLARDLPLSRTPEEAIEVLLDFRVRIPPSVNNDLPRADQVRRAFLRWRERAPGRPYMAFLNIFDAHRPYESPDPWRSRFAPDTSAMARYDGAVAWIDHEVDDLLATLATRGELDNTVVIVTSDHGEQFGAHGVWLHNNSLYMQVLRVPFFIRFPPAVPAGRRIGTQVSLRDLPATVLDMAGGDPARLPGRSLARMWAGDSAAGGVVLAQMQRSIDAQRWDPARRGAMRTAIDAHWHYILNGDGREQLYDYRNDPSERFNLARTDQGRAALPALRTAVAELPPQP